MNCGESSEQIRRLLETYLILVKHGNGSKITKPVDVCEVSSQLHLFRVCSLKSVAKCTLFFLLFYRYYVKQYT